MLPSLCAVLLVEKSPQITGVCSLIRAGKDYVAAAIAWGVKNDLKDLWSKLDRIAGRSRAVFTLQFG